MEEKDYLPPEGWDSIGDEYSSGIKVGKLIKLILLFTIVVGVVASMSLILVNSLK